MLDRDVSYREESEIDKAFVYLDKLDAEIEELENSEYICNFNLFSIFSKKDYKNSNIEITKKKILKTHNFIKDGYEFRIRLEAIYTVKKTGKTNILHFLFKYKIL